MRKEYIRPEISVIQMKTEQSILTGSVFGSMPPVPDAIEGNTENWGIWL